MTDDEMEELFDKFSESDFLKFDLVEAKRSNRADLHAFLLLDELCPSENCLNIVSGASHDVFYLDTDPSELVKVATEELVLELVRCGLMYESQYNCFSMFT